jgi:hypothetical protein
MKSEVNRVCQVELVLSLEDREAAALAYLMATLVSRGLVPVGTLDYDVATAIKDAIESVIFDE